jgi:hypothetical protein
MSIREMLDKHPRPTTLDREALLRCLDECVECAATCTSCADACLGEQDVQALVRSVRLNLDCADLCDTVGRIVTRQTEPDLGVIRTAIDACVTACRACAAECDRHAAHHEHCRICADVCRRCERACDDLLATMG